VTDLAAFLLARVAEDEAVANRFNGSAYSRWKFEPDPNRSRIGGRVVGLTPYAEVANDWSSPHGPAGYIGISPHIARWDPARVLAECDAKRRIAEDLNHSQPHDSDWLTAQTVLRLLVLPYSDHPDYRAEWRGAVR
jgi:hypothetical protein